MRLVKLLKRRFSSLNNANKFWSNFKHIDLGEIPHLLDVCMIKAVKQRAQGIDGCEQIAEDLGAIEKFKQEALVRTTKYYSVAG